MSSYKRKLRDLSGNYVFPATRSTCVYLDDNQTLQEWIDSQSDSSGIDILDVYPVGSIYMNDTSSTSPTTLFGGTWTRIYSEFLFGVPPSFSPDYPDYQVGTSGGEMTHVLTTEEMPIHDHNPIWNTTEYTILDIRMIHVDNEEISTTGTGPRLIHRSSSSSKKAGGGRAHNNMPPYYCVYMWKRLF